MASDSVASMLQKDSDGRWGLHNDAAIILWVHKGPLVLKAGKLKRPFALWHLVFGTFPGACGVVGDMGGIR